MRTVKTDSLTRRLVFASICLALCMMLPFLTGQIPQVGAMLCPMHIPVFLAGFLCGPWWAMAVGGVAPILRYALFGMPPPMPTGLAMCFELLAYGALCGLLYRVLPRCPASVYLALVGAMLGGRIVWGGASIVLYGAAGTPFTWPIFLAGAFVNAIPGIVLHLLLVPVIVLALYRAGILGE